MFAYQNSGFKIKKNYFNNKILLKLITVNDTKNCNSLWFSWSIDFFVFFQLRRIEFSCFSALSQYIFLHALVEQNIDYGRPKKRWLGEHWRDYWELRRDFFCVNKSAIHRYQCKRCPCDDKICYCISNKKRNIK